MLVCARLRAGRPLVVAAALVEAIAAAQPNYVVVLINGGALGVDWIAKNSPAVVEAFYP